MKNLPLVAHASIVNNDIEYRVLDASTEEEALPAVLDVINGVTVSASTRVTEVQRETTDDK